MKCLWSDIRQVLGEYLKREKKKSEVRTQQGRQRLDRSWSLRLDHSVRMGGGRSPCLEGKGQVKVNVSKEQTKVKEQEETGTWEWGGPVADRTVLSPKGVRRLGSGEPV